VSPRRLPAAQWLSPATQKAFTALLRPREPNVVLGRTLWRRSTDRREISDRHGHGALDGWQ